MALNLLWYQLTQQDACSGTPKQCCMPSMNSPVASTNHAPLLCSCRRRRWRQLQLCNLSVTLVVMSTSVDGWNHISAQRAINHLQRLPDVSFMKTFTGDCIAIVASTATKASPPLATSRATWLCTPDARITRVRFATISLATDICWSGTCWRCTHLSQLHSSFTILFSMAFNRHLVDGRWRKIMLFPVVLNSDRVIAIGEQFDLLYGYLPGPTFLFWIVFSGSLHHLNVCLIGSVLFLNCRHTHMQVGIILLILR